MECVLKTISVEFIGDLRNRARRNPRLREILPKNLFPRQLRAH
jgi:hypothetical protein